MSVKQGQSQEYKILKAEITSEKIEDGIDVAAQIGELKIFESLDKPYLTGIVGILDDHGVFQKSLKFKGTEKLSLTVQTLVGGEEEYTFDHEFIMTGIERKIRISDKSEVFIFSLIDIHAFIDSTIKLSKSYRGKIEDIITRIILGELNIEVDQSYITTSIQPDIQVIVPYLSPIQTIQWLVQRATTEHGSPYWVHASMFDSRIRISSFDGMYVKEPFNLNLPFLYSMASANSAAKLGPAAQSQIIKEIKFENMENIMRMVSSGAIGSQLTSTDVFKNKNLVATHKASETLEKLKSAEIIPSDSKQNVYDEEYLIDTIIDEPRPLDEQTSRVMHSLTSENTYYGINNYHDAFNEAQVGDKLRNNAIRRLLEKNTIDITVTGISIFIRKVSVGDTVYVKIYNSDVNDESSLDEERSGIYLIRNAVHVFNDRQHNVTLTITKLNTIKKSST
jgi:hypothetical protein